MNERIQELYRQAFVPHTTTCPDNNMPYETVLFSTEKFAELIVREMLVTCEDHPAWTGRMIGNQIKEHFGVK